MNRRLAWTLLLALAVVFVVAGQWQPHNVDAVDLANRHASPSIHHILGTDHLGRDVFSRLMVGASNTLIVLLTIGLVAGGMGLLVGTLAAVAPVNVERLLLRLADLSIVVPSLVLALFLTALIGLTPLTAGIALGLGAWGNYAILTHGLAKAVQARPYYAAAEALGTPPVGRIGRHLVPNILTGVLTYMASDAGRHVTGYAALAFIGLGADTSRPDWGAMLFEYRAFMFDNPALMLWPGLAIFAVVLLFHLALEPDARRPGRGPQGGRWRLPFDGRAGRRVSIDPTR